MVHIYGENVFIILNQSPFLKRKNQVPCIFHGFFSKNMSIIYNLNLFPLNTNSLRIVTWLTKL